MTTKTATGFVLQNGVCTNDLSGFSGSAVASQALSGLAQTATQMTTGTTENTIADRRQKERERCPEGFRRIDGNCERAPPAMAEAPTVTPPARPVEEPVFEQRRPPEVVAAPREEAPAPAPSRAVTKTQRKRAAKPAPEVVRHVPPPPPPLPIEAPVRFGTWTQLYGDYEHRNATGPGSTFSLLANSPVPLDLNVTSKTSTIGFQVGADMTTRSLFSPDDGLIVGALAGYVSTKLKLNTASLSTNVNAVLDGFSTLSANLSGPEAGLYATYFNGGFSTDVLAKFDVLHLNENFTDTIAFSPGPNDVNTPPFLFTSTGSGSVGLLSTTLAANLNYRFDLYPNFWIEPTVGAQYTNLSYGSGADQLGLEDGSLVMVQGGARVGTNFLIGPSIRTTAVVTGLVYDDVLVAGGFIPGAAFAANNILAHADQGQVRGRGIVALNFDFGQGFTSFVQGEARGGKGLFGAGGKAGLRYQW